MLRGKRDRKTCSWGCCGTPCKPSVYRTREKRQWQREQAA